MDVWWLWLIAVVGSLVMFLAVRGKRLTAGADWFDENGAWIKTYELTSVRIIGAWGGDLLELKDEADRKVSVKLPHLLENRALWDLVYNGILHSACSGRATVTQLARERLRLPPGVRVVAGGSTRPRRMSTVSKVVHVVLAILSVVAGLLVLASAAGLVFSGEAFKSVFNIGFLVFLLLVSAGFVWGYVWLKRRLER